jgi:nucleoside 2-deoxyribosyltransferase
MPRVYCAGPLFNDAERREMAEIAAAFPAPEYCTFLPHRDGLEFARLVPEFEAMGLAADSARFIMERAIFSFDVYQLLERCDAVVANLNGRVPDEGTVVEATLAWYAGKALVLYKSDARSLFSGADNPMLAGLGEFRQVSDRSMLPAAVEEQLRIGPGRRVPRVTDLGCRIAALREMCTSSNPADVAKGLWELVGTAHG